jgi:hypothetical protein
VSTGAEADAGAKAKPKGKEEGKFNLDLIFSHFSIFHTFFANVHRHSIIKKPYHPSCFACH